MIKSWKQLKPALTAATLVITLAGAIPLGAQSTPAPATCTTPPPGLTTLNFERSLTLANVLTTLTPNLPANVLASIAGGAQEIREIFIYNAQQNTVTSTVFLVASGAPLPTPNFNFQTGVIQSTTVKISQILTSCTPVPSLLIVGTVNNTTASAGVYGNVNGALAAISIGYTVGTSTTTPTTPTTPTTGTPTAMATTAADTPATINSVVEVLAGLVVAYSPAGTGTVVFPAVPVTPPGSTGNTSIIVTSPQLGTLTSSGTKVIQVTQGTLLLDASGSTGSAPLTFNWSSSGAPVNFLPVPGKPGQIQVTFPGKGFFTVLLTVTDSTGTVSPPFIVVFQSV